jgi:serine/threonine protein phosphatase PrpC
MPQLQHPLVTLSIENGMRTGETPFVRTAGCDQIGAPGVNSFFAILEPMSLHPEMADLAPLILERLEQELATRQKVTATAAISASVEAVNAELFYYNQDREEDDRLYFGLTCGLTREDDLYIAQVLPSQILISQDGVLHVFPELETWHWSRRSDPEVSLEQPLGVHGEIEPDLYHTRIEPGDLIVLCSGSLARVLQREPQDVFVRGDAQAAITHLQELTEAYNVDNASSVAIAVTRQPKRSRRRHDLAFLRTVTAAVGSFLPEETAQRLRRRSASSEPEVDTETPARHTERQQGDTGDARSSAVDTIYGDAGASSTADGNQSAYNSDQDEEPEYWDPHGQWEAGPAEPYPGELEGGYADPERNREGKRTLTEIVAGAVLALVAAIIGIWQLAVNRDRSIDGPREDESTFGLPRLQRYDNSMQGPDFTGVRRRLPRAPINKYAGFVSVGLVFALAAGLIYSISSSRDRERTEEFEALMGQATAARQNAIQANDPVIAQSFLEASEARLDEAAALGVDDEVILTEQAAIVEARDASLGIERLGNIQVLGGVPSAPDGVAPNLFFGNGQLYVFTDALYQLDPENSRLLRLITPGDEIGGQAVGELQGAAWGHGSPMVMDGRGVYIYDSTSTSWTRHELGSFGSEYSDIAAISGYIGNLYLLSPQAGQILRYHGDQFDALPEDWTGGSAAEELATGVDMMIDGRIYVLTAEGQVLDFYRGALDDTVAINATPAIDSAVAFSYQTDRSHMYIADAHDRILRVNTDGQVVQQFMSESEAPPLENIQQIAVDDALGSAYVLTDNALMQVRLPGPPRQD